MIFPSVAWFKALGTEMESDRARHRHIGEIDTTCVFTILNTPGEGEVNIRCVFEELSLIQVKQLVGDFDPTEVGIDFILEGDFSDWRSMIDHIKANDGRAGREFTLNYLSLPGIPFRCWSPDPLGRDMFFRFNQSLQAFINASYRLDTQYPSPAG
jgi:hypothetical protein